MRIMTGFDNWHSKTSVGSVALGFFDGVHVGHQSIIMTTVQEAQRQALPSVVLSFEPHPLAVINPDLAPKLITSLSKKTELIAQLGVDFLLVLPFTLTLADTDAFTFARLVLTDVLKTKHLTVGYNYSFGHKRRGTPEKLTAWGRELGFGVTIVPPVTCDGEVVSSSRIRQLISQGEVAKAATILGRCPTISGQVVRGAGRGHCLGFPTANITLNEELVLPRFGVYAVRSQYQDKHLYGVANIGLVPTYGYHTARLEVNFFEFGEDLYGQYLCIELISFLRPERKFVSADALKDQMEVDKQQAIRIFTYTDRKVDRNCLASVYNRGAL